MLQYIIDGGVLMVPLMGCSVVVLAVIIDRVRAFRLAEADTTRLRARVLASLEQGKVDDAIAACEQFKGPVAAVLLVGLLKYRKLAQLGRSLAEIEGNVTKTMSDYAPHVMEALEKRLDVLSMIASVAPLLGMTGTVVGMIASFGSMQELGGIDASAVAGGIAVALITTATGLLIAIPAVIAHSIFARRVDKYVLQIEETATGLIDFITLDHGQAA